MDSFLSKPFLLGKSRGASGAFALQRRLGSPQGLFLDFTDDSSLIIDGAVPANNYRGKAFDKLTFTRASTASRFNNLGVLETVASGSWRIDHDPATLARRGLLIEGARTNLLTYSEAFDNAAWTKGAVTATVTADATTSPAGTATADLIDSSSTDINNRVTQVATVANDSTAYSQTLYVKRGTAQYFRLDLRFVGGTSLNYAYVFDFTGGTATLVTGGNTAIQVSFTAVGNGWYRAVISGANNSLGNTQAQLWFYPSTNSFGTAITAGNSYAWGAQLEAGAIPSSYIPTAGATVTRAAENCTLATSLFPASSQGPYSIFVKGITPPYTAGDSNRAIFGLGDGTTNENRYLDRSGTTGNVMPSNVAGGSFNFTLTAQTPGAFVSFKAAVRYALNSGNWAYNGTIATDDTTCALPAAPSALTLGNLRSGGGNHWHGWIQQIAVIPVALTDAQLQAVTA